MNQITLLGAVGGEVTGSSYLLETSKGNLLIDFGLFQGTDELDKKNVLPKLLNPKNLDAILLTHGHLDHCGRLPLLAKTAFKGPIYCTKPTAELATLVLKDSIKILAEDTERLNKKRMQKGLPPLKPSMQIEDVNTITKQFHIIRYNDLINITQGIKAKFVDAGHMLGSASIQITLHNGDVTKKIVFSGDLGYPDLPILSDPEGFKNGDIIFLESTYGNRNHRSFQATAKEFESIIQDAIREKSKILIPVFAIGKTQLLLYLLAVMFRNSLIPKFPIYVDSPMAIDATEIYQNHIALFDAEYKKLNQEKPLASDLKTVYAVESRQESKKLNNIEGPCLIMAGSGMCTGGRIVHHLKHSLARPETIVIIPGYQAHGSLGRDLVDGKDPVVIMGDEIPVRAKIHTLNGFSAHAGQSDLLHWLEPMTSSKPRVYLTHGEDTEREALKEKIKDRFSIYPGLPKLEETIEI
jgi:metallo-beta-lactamase family protein